MAEGLHYLLDLRGTEELYRPREDPLERRDLKNDPGREAALNRFRNALGEIVRDNRATGVVASAYLKQLRAMLGSMIPRPPL